MHLRLMNLVQQMCQRIVSSRSLCTTYIREVKKLQSHGFYPVYVGKTEISECLVTGDISPLNASLRNHSTLSIIHAGGALGWVPWNYKLYFSLSDRMLKPDEEIFQELCAELNDHYRNCAIIVTPHILREMQNQKSGNSVYPTAPVELLPMICCPKVAQSYGHKMLQIPMHDAHRSPLNKAWSTVKCFMNNQIGNYTEVSYYRGTIHQLIHMRELVDGALNQIKPPNTNGWTQ